MGLKKTYSNTAFEQCISNLSSSSFMAFSLASISFNRHVQSLVTYPWRGDRERRGRGEGRREGEEGGRGGRRD